MTPAEVRNLVAVMVNLWPNVPMRVEPDAVLITTWHAVLNDTPYSEAEAMVVAAAKRGDTFPPAPGAVSAWVGHARAIAAGTAAPAADEAWTEVQRAVAQRGYMAGPPEWSHAAVGEAVRALGWRELCTSTAPGVVRAHFLRFYEAALARTEGPPALARGPERAALPRDTPSV